MLNELTTKVIKRVKETDKETLVRKLPVILTYGLAGLGLLSALKPHRIKPDPTTILVLNDTCYIVEAQNEKTQK